MADASRAIKDAMVARVSHLALGKPPGWKLKALNAMDKKSAFVLTGFLEEPDNAVAVAFLDYLLGAGEIGCLECSTPRVNIACNLETTW